jgi:hypothetical protein
MGSFSVVDDTWKRRVGSVAVRVIRNTGSEVDDVASSRLGVSNVEYRTGLRYISQKDKAIMSSWVVKFAMLTETK